VYYIPDKCTAGGYVGIVYRMNLRKRTQDVSSFFQTGLNEICNSNTSSNIIFMYTMGTICNR